jgi:glyoxylase-like metal-dependent hydrolase (beta-lactamase superfamily II)
MAGLLNRRLARFAIGPDQTLTAQLARIGYDVADVRTAVLSHLHIDHVGGLPELSHATVVTSHAERRTLDRPFATMNGLLRRHVLRPGLRWELITPRPTHDPSLEPFTAAHDLLGDGSLTVLHTPGHTPGSLSLLVRRPDFPPLLMVGDLTFDLSLMEHEQLPGLGHRGASLATTRKINALRQTHPDLVVLPAHDPRAAERLATTEQPDPPTARREPGESDVDNRPPESDRCS